MQSHPGGNWPDDKKQEAVGILVTVLSLHFLFHLLHILTAINIYFPQELYFRQSKTKKRYIVGKLQAKVKFVQTYDTVY